MAKSKRVEYTDEDRQEFIDVASEMGVGPAMRELGYPGSWHTAHKWLEDAGVEITKDALKSKARQLGIFYEQKDKVIAAQTVLARIVEMIDSDKDLDAEGINKLTNSLYKVIQTLNLITGEATDRRENVTRDTTDLAIVDLINEQKARNDDTYANIHRDNG